MADLTKMMENAFGKYELVKSGKVSLQEVTNNHITVSKASTESLGMADSHNASLYPERIGRKRREEKEKSQHEQESFINSITEAEYTNLVILSRDRIMLSKDQLISMGENGEDLETERLENAGCIKREKIPDDDLIQFNITGKGRQLLNELNKRLNQQ